MDGLGEILDGLGGTFDGLACGDNAPVGKTGVKIASDGMASIKRIECLILVISDAKIFSMYFIQNLTWLCFDVNTMVVQISLVKMTKANSKITCYFNAAIRL